MHKIYTAKEVADEHYKKFYKELLKLGFSIEVENHNIIIKW